MSGILTAQLGVNTDRRTNSAELQVGNEADLGLEGVAVYVQASAAIPANARKVHVTSTFSASNTGGRYRCGTAFAANEYGWVIKPQVVALPTGTSTNDVVMLPREFAQIRRSNSLKQSVLPNIYPDEDHEFLHASLLHFPNGWNQWTWWCLFTPYPAEQGEFENPSIAVSNDGLTWQEPVGMDNPIQDRPYSDTNNADTHLWYDKDEDRLVALWTHRGVTVGNALIMAYSYNGIDWTIVDDYIWQDTDAPGSGGARGIQSPSLWYDDDAEKYYILGIDPEDASSPPRTAWRISSDSLTSGWDAEPTTVAFEPETSMAWWNVALRRLPNGVLIGVAQENVGAAQSGDIYPIWSFGSATITAISKANPAVCTTSGRHPFHDGDYVYISGAVDAGMTELTDGVYTVAKGSGTYNYDTFGLTGINSSAYSTFSGTATADKGNGLTIEHGDKIVQRASGDPGYTPGIVVYNNGNEPVGRVYVTGLSIGYMWAFDVKFDRDRFALENRAQHISNVYGAVMNSGNLLWGDSFVRSDDATALGTADLGGTYPAEDGGVWGIISNQAYGVTAATNNRQHFDVGTDQYVFSIQVNTFGEQTYIAACYVTSGNQIRFGKRVSTDLNYKFERFASSETGIGEYQSAKIQDGDIITMVRNKQFFTFYVNGVHMLDYEETEPALLANTKVGIQCYTDDTRIGSIVCQPLTQFI